MEGLMSINIPMGPVRVLHFYCVMFRLLEYRGPDILEDLRKGKSTFQQEEVLALFALNFLPFWSLVSVYLLITSLC